LARSFLSFKAKAFESGGWHTCQHCRYLSDIFTWWQCVQKLYSRQNFDLFFIESFG
jgi:hypothetical protein